MASKRRGRPRILAMYPPLPPEKEIRAEVFIAPTDGNLPRRWDDAIQARINNYFLQDVSEEKMAEFLRLPMVEVQQRVAQIRQEIQQRINSEITTLVQEEVYKAIERSRKRRKYIGNYRKWKNRQGFKECAAELRQEKEEDQWTMHLLDKYLLSTVPSDRGKDSAPSEIFTQLITGFQQSSDTEQDISLDISLKRAAAGDDSEDEEVE